MSYAPLYRILTGSRLVLNGRDWLVTGREDRGYALEGVDDGECLTLSFEWADQAIKDRICDVTAPADLEKREALLRHTGGFELIEQLPEEQQEHIRHRLSIVLAMDALEAEGKKITERSINKGGKYRKALKTKASDIHGGGTFLDAVRGGRVTASFAMPQGRTLKKYQSIFHQFGDKPIVLMEREHMKGNRSRRLSALQEIYTEHAITLWLERRKPKLAPLLRLVEAEFHVPTDEVAAGFTFPSITTIRARIKALSRFVKEGGRNGWQYTRNRIGAGSTDIGALYYGEKTETDQVYLSIFTDTGGTVRARRLDPKAAREDLAADEICRLWLHVMIDVATRLPMAWIIAKSADADHTEALLRMATRDKTREKVRYECKKDPAPPVRLMKFEADNGTATRNGRVYAAQLGSGMTVIPARAYHSGDKPHIETLFGTIQWDVLNFLPGYTGSRPGELNDYDPKASVATTHDEIYGTLTRYFVDEYSHKPHRGVGMFGATPWEKMVETITTYREIDAPKQRERCLHLGVKTNVKSTSEGVEAFNIPFSSTAFKNFSGGAPREVTIHLDPDDLRIAYVTAQGHADAIKVNLSMTAFSDLTLEEAITLMEETARRNPKAQELHDAHLKETRARRARESGYFPDTRDPSNYLSTDQLRRRASQLAQVSFRPQGVTRPTAQPGRLTDRTGSTPAFKVGEGTPASTAKPSPKDLNSRPTGKTFTPIKDSKL